MQNYLDYPLIKQYHCQGEPKQIQCIAVFTHPEINKPLGLNIFQRSHDDAKQELYIEDT